MGVVEPRKRVVPIDYASAMALGNWRENLTFPLPQAEVERAMVAASRRYLALVAELADEERRILLLAISVLTAGLDYLISAMCCQRSAALGWALATKAPEISYLSGLDGAKLEHARGFGEVPAEIGPARHPILISAWMTRKWTPPLLLPAALVSPDRVAVSTNALLIDAARASDQRTRFWPAGQLLAQARRNGAVDTRSEPVRRLAAIAARSLVDETDLEEPFRSRLIALLEAHSMPILATAAGDLAALGEASGIPRDMWSGSGGFYPARAVGLEVLRRGGTVTRFDHVGTFSVMSAPESAALVELSVSSRFVMPTRQGRRNLLNSDALDLVSGDRQVEVSGHRGDPLYRGLNLMRRRPVGEPRRVVYAPTLVREFGKHPYLSVPPLVYLDWQLRLAEKMVEFPINLVCKPHPCGLFENRRHPLADIAATSTRTFEEEIADADVFVFDAERSTAFWEAICTDRPIVLIKLWPPAHHPDVAEALAERCTILIPSRDDDDIPKLEDGLLKDAILGAPERADPSFFHRLLMGDAGIA